MSDYFVHESSYVDDNVSIGSGTKIWHFCHVQSGAVIGDSCVLGQNVNIGNDVVIGNNVKIQNNVSIYKGTTVEDDVFIGPSAVLTNVINPRSAINRKSEFKTTLLKKGCTVGANATIVCGNVLGEYCFIGAGSVVTSDINAYVLAYGNPARFQGYFCSCGNRISWPDNLGFDKHWKCLKCKCLYSREIDKLVFVGTYD